MVLVVGDLSVLDPSCLCCICSCNWNGHYGHCSVVYISCHTSFVNISAAELDFPKPRTYTYTMPKDTKNNNSEPIKDDESFAHCWTLKEGQPPLHSAETCALMGALYNKKTVISIIAYLRKHFPTDVAKKYTSRKEFYIPSEEVRKLVQVHLKNRPPFIRERFEKEGIEWNQIEHWIALERYLNWRDDLNKMELGQMGQLGNILSQLMYPTEQNNKKKNPRDIPFDETNEYDPENEDGDEDDDKPAF